MIDLRTLDFDAFVALAFDHPAYEGQDVEVEGHRVVRIIEKRPPAWYWDVGGCERMDGQITSI